jgi:hypothetical protein
MTQVCPSNHFEISDHVFVKILTLLEEIFCVFVLFQKSKFGLLVSVFRMLDVIRKSSSVVVKTRMQMGLKLHYILSELLRILFDKSTPLHYRNTVDEFTSLDVLRAN